MTSGVYYRIQRDGRHKSVDFAEMNSEERRSVLANLERVELERLIMILSDKLIEKEDKIRGAIKALGVELMEE